jgi:hypothetical protein
MWIRIYTYYKGDKPTLVESKTLEMDNSDFDLDSDEDYS